MDREFPPVEESLQRTSICIREDWGRYVRLPLLLLQVLIDPLLALQGLGGGVVPLFTSLSLLLLLGVVAGGCAIVRRGCGRLSLRRLLCVRLPAVYERAAFYE